MSEEIIIEPIKVQVTIYLGFDDESDKALQTAWNVAKKLLEQKNIWVEIIPVHIWLTDPIGLEIPDLPKILVNGRTAFIGRAPSEEELIDYIMDRLGETPPPRQEGIVFAATYYTGFFEGAAMVG